MAITSDTTQPITMFMICDEFGVPRSTPLRDFYRGQGIVPDTATNSSIPSDTTQPISFFDFYGASNLIREEYTASGTLHRAPDNSVTHWTCTSFSPTSWQGNTLNQTIIDGSAITLIINGSHTHTGTFTTFEIEGFRLASSSATFTVGSTYCTWKWSLNTGTAWKTSATKTMYLELE